MTTTGSGSFLRVSELARGGMGTVELVLRKEREFTRLFVLKRLLPAHRDDPSFRSMFLDEARVAGLLRHPNVVSVLDVGEDDDGPFLVMEYVEGMSLAALASWSRSRGALLPVQLCARIAAAVARGLHAAHELRAHDGTPLELVHRDVTPHNILVGYDGDVRVTDFGIAKAYGRRSRTSTGVLKGKLAYMSPEQLRFHDPDRRSDLFALGVVLFELLASKRLYAGEGMEGARRTLEEPPPDIGEVRDDVPAALVELSFDLLAKAPDDRPASAAEVADRLDAIVAELQVDEGSITVGPFLEERFGEHRRSARAELDRAIRRAEETDAAVVPSPARAWPIARWRTVALVLIAIAAGAAGTALLREERDAERTLVRSPEAPVAEPAAGRAVDDLPPAPAVIAAPVTEPAAVEEPVPVPEPRRPDARRARRPDPRGPRRATEAGPARPVAPMMEPVPAPVPQADPVPLWVDYEG